MGSSDDSWGKSDSTQRAEDPDDLVGLDLLGKLRVLRLIGGGGMGAVYEVEHLITGHRRALKVLKSRYVAIPQSTERLMREAGVAGRLGTPYVPETYDAGYLEDGSAYVLMELLDGRPLLDLFQERGRLGISHVAGLMVQVCEGLALAHDDGIIHRDLKPENIFLVPSSEGSDRVKILDFGIAKFTKGRLDDAPNRLTADGTILGTPYYMSPEQAMGGLIDHRTDVYAVGVMIYEGITGMLPFDGKGVGAVFAKIQQGDYVPLSVMLPDADPTFEAMVRKAMHREPEQRFQSAEALRQALLPFAPSDAVSRGRTIPDAQRGITLDYSSGKPANPERDSETLGLPAAAARDAASTPPARLAQGGRLPTPRTPLPPHPRPGTPAERDRPAADALSPRQRISGRPSRLFASTTRRRRVVWGAAGVGVLVAIVVALVALGGDSGGASTDGASTGGAASPAGDPQPIPDPDPTPPELPSEVGETVSPQAQLGMQSPNLRADAGPGRKGTGRVRPPPEGEGAGAAMQRPTPAETVGLEMNPYRQ